MTKSPPRLKMNESEWDLGRSVEMGLGGATSPLTTSLSIVSLVLRKTELHGHNFFNRGMLYKSLQSLSCLSDALEWDNKGFLV